MADDLSLEIKSLKNRVRELETLLNNEVENRLSKEQEASEYLIQKFSLGMIYEMLVGLALLFSQVMQSQYLVQIVGLTMLFNSIKRIINTLPGLKKTLTNFVFPPLRRKRLAKRL
jgi:hypothetical protein